MKEKADKWQMDLVELGFSFEKNVKPLSLDKLNYKPSGNTWSVAENLAHLMAVNTSYFPIFEEIKKGTYQSPWWTKIPWLPQKTGELLLRAMMAPTKTKTFGKWAPEKSLYDERILSDFFDQQHTLSHYIQDLEPFLGNGIVISSPLNKWITYTLPTAFEIIIAHEERHLKQILATIKS